MSTELMSEDVLEFWRAHSINKSVLLGHSMGGRTAMFTSLQHPELVDKLVVLDVAPTGTSGADTIRMVQVLKNVDLTSVKDKYEVDDIIKEHIPVSATLSVDTILSCLNAGVMPCQVNISEQAILSRFEHQCRLWSTALVHCIASSMCTLCMYVQDTYYITYSNILHSVPHHGYPHASS